MDFITSLMNLAKTSIVQEHQAKFEHLSTITHEVSLISCLIWGGGGWFVTQSRWVWTTSNQTGFFCQRQHSIEGRGLLPWGKKISLSKAPDDWEKGFRRTVDKHQKMSWRCTSFNPVSLFDSKAHSLENISEKIQSTLSYVFSKSSLCWSPGNPSLHLVWMHSLVIRAPSNICLPCTSPLGLINDNQ